MVIHQQETTILGSVATLLMRQVVHIFNGHAYEIGRTDGGGRWDKMRRKDQITVGQINKVKSLQADGWQVNGVIAADHDQAMTNGWLFVVMHKGDRINLIDRSGRSLLRGEFAKLGNLDELAELFAVSSTAGVVDTLRREPPTAGGVCVLCGEPLASKSCPGRLCPECTPDRV